MFLSIEVRSRKKTEVTQPIIGRSFDKNRSCRFFLQIANKFFVEQKKSDDQSFDFSSFVSSGPINLFSRRKRVERHEEKKKMNVIVLTSYH